RLRREGDTYVCRRHLCGQANGDGQRWRHRRPEQQHHCHSQEMRTQTGESIASLTVGRLLRDAQTALSPERTVGVAKKTWTRPGRRTERADRVSTPIRDFVREKIRQSCHEPRQYESAIHLAPRREQSSELESGRAGPGAERRGKNCGTVSARV